MIPPMRHTATSILLFLLVLFALACEPPPTYRVGTFNMRSDQWDAPGSFGQWDERHIAAIDAVLAQDADLWTFQEVGPRQLLELRATLGQTHEFHELDVMNGDRLVLAYRFERFEAHALKGAVMSEWGDIELRLAGGIVLEDRLTGSHFYFAGTHLGGTLSQLAKARAFALEPFLPVLIAGDFNALSNENPWAPANAREMEKGGELRDVFREAPHRVVDSSCWTGDPARVGPEACANHGLDSYIDIVYGSREFIGVRSWTVQAWSEDGIPISDHFPQVVDVEVRL